MTKPDYRYCVIPFHLFEDHN